MNIVLKYGTVAQFISILYIHLRMSNCSMDYRLVPFPLPATSLLILIAIWKWTPFNFVNLLTNFAYVKPVLSVIDVLVEYSLLLLYFEDTSFTAIFMIVFSILSKATLEELAKENRFCVYSMNVKLLIPSRFLQFLCSECLIGFLFFLPLIVHPLFIYASSYCL